MNTVRIFLFSLLGAFAISASAQDGVSFFELRTYHTNDGKLDDLHDRFRDHTCKLFEKHGMTNIGYWTPNDQPETLIYLLGYPDLESRKASWKGFLNDPDWKAAYGKSIENGKLVKNVESVFLKPTDYSKMPPLTRSDTNRLFELRIYTTNEGKLDDLNARFRDHTCQLFENHGIQNFAYFTPVKREDEAANKLVYLISHNDEESRNASFKAFSQDPAWIQAKDESQKDGPILVKKGVQSTFLTPTDYSPVN
ncbi:MAG: NIPSNAP family protein [Verrucomicrobiales bacterium]|nr:NIPSNAP family protein [Verrucomicrobiales bacterium]